MADVRGLEPRVALLRGINVGGRNRIAMADLRALCAERGMVGVETYIQSGNVVFRSDRERSPLEEELEEGIAKRFGVSVAVLVRSGTEWRSYIESNPFPEESAREPNLVMLALSKSRVPHDAAERLTARADAGERIIAGGGALWIHYPAGAGRSRLSPGLFDRVFGSPATTRNWLTVKKIGSMMGIEVVSEGR